MMMEIKNTSSGNQEVLDGTTVIKTLAPGACITVRDAVGSPPPLGLAAAVSQWNTAHASDRVITGGLDPYATDTGLGTGSGGGTFFDLALTRAIRQHGPITAVRLNFSAIGPVRIQIWRPNGSGVLTLIEQTATFTPPSTGEYLYVLPTPLVLAKPGDVPGIWGDNATLRCKQVTTLETGWAAGAPTSITLSGVPSGYQYNRILGLTFYGPPPFGAIAGDSIDAGHGNPFYRTHLDGGPSGDPTGEPAHHIRAAVGGLTTQNFAKGSTGWQFSADNIGKIDAVCSRFVVFGAGINDLAESWPTTAARLAACKAGLTHGQVMFVREITPDNAAPTGAVASRNTLRASWCASNGAIVIPCHDAMAQTRPSTGLLENLKSTYDDGSGIHHNLAGKQKMADLIRSALNAYNWAA